MCDYSLHGIPNRLAREGDELVVHRFGTGTIGLIAASDLDSRNRLRRPQAPTIWAWIKQVLEMPPKQGEQCVCVPPGAELMIQDISPSLGRSWRAGKNDTVRFTQVSAEVNAHRDALVLPDGREVLLQRVPEGLKVQVASLGGSQAMAEESESIPQVRYSDSTL